MYDNFDMSDKATKGEVTAVLNLVRKVEAELNEALAMLEEMGCANGFFTGSPLSRWAQLRQKRRLAK